MSTLFGSYSRKKFYKQNNLSTDISELTVLWLVLVFLAPLETFDFCKDPEAHSEPTSHACTRRSTRDLLTGQTVSLWYVGCGRLFVMGPVPNRGTRLRWPTWNLLRTSGSLYSTEGTVTMIHVGHLKRYKSGEGTFKISRIVGSSISESVEIKSEGYRFSWSLQWVSIYRGRSFTEFYLTTLPKERHPLSVNGLIGGRGQGGGRRFLSGDQSGETIRTPWPSGKYFLESQWLNL